MAYKSGHIYLIDHEPNAEELANFTKPVQFDICVAGLYYSIIYDKNGNKYVEDRSQVVTGFIKVGEFTQEGNQITIGVHPSGFNHWRINGVDITRSTPITLEVDAVPDGQFRIDSIVGNQAGGIFILQGTAGKFPIRANPLNYPNFAFFLEIQVTPDGLGGGIVELSLSNVFTGNGANLALDIKEASATERGTMSASHWIKLEGINLSDYVTNSTLSVRLSDYATTIALTSGLANRYQITTTNITAPDATYWAALITDSSGNVRRLNLANYLSDNYVPLSSQSVLKYGTQNPPTLAQLTSLGIKRGDYYIHTSDGTSAGAEIQRTRYNGAQLEDWTVASAIYSALSQAQKDAVKYINVTP